MGGAAKFKLLLMMEMIAIDLQSIRAGLNAGGAFASDGGTGSGNYGHKGRPGEVGGSAPSEGGGGAVPKDGMKMQGPEDIKANIRYRFKDAVKKARARHENALAIAKRRLERAEEREKAYYQRALESLGEGPASSEESGRPGDDDLEMCVPYIERAMKAKNRGELSSIKAELFKEIDKKHGYKDAGSYLRASADGLITTIEMDKFGVLSPYEIRQEENKQLSEMESGVFSQWRW